MRHVAAATAVALVAVAVGTATAEAPWNRLKLFKKVDADPNVDYVLAQQNGPWMIMAATFAEKGADDQARALIYELRKKHNLPAYMHRKTFDFTKSVQGLGVDKYGRKKNMRHLRDIESEEIAVLVGNYAAVDDPKAQRDLELVKSIYPDALRPNKAGKSNQQLAWWYNLRQQVLREKGNKHLLGPMGRAFVTTNPLLPPQFFANASVDKFVENMNRGVKHSLLDCPGKYSVLVATFKGEVVIDQSRIQRIESGDEQAKSELVDAADKAHRVCLALRAKGYEAYEFHDRSASMVTIGSFDSLGTPRNDGKTEINPDIYKIMQTFAGADAGLPPNLVYRNALRPAIGRRPKILEEVGVPLDVQPLPVQVPKRSFQSSIGVR